MTVESDEVRATLCKLRRSTPQKFGYLANNWRAAKEGLDKTDRAFARAAHIHTNIANPDLDTRTLGYTLEILVELDVLDAEHRRTAATLYDLRGYTPDSLATIGRALTDG